MYAAAPGPVSELRQADVGRPPRSEAELAKALAKLGVDVAAIEASLKTKSGGDNSSSRITW